jgi:hypothetical protein
LVAVTLAASFAAKVTFEVPEAVGVPVMLPLVESASPAGRLPEAILHVYGVVPPEAVSDVL